MKTKHYNSAVLKIHNAMVNRNEIITKWESRKVFASKRGIKWRCSRFTIFFFLKMKSSLKIEHVLPNYSFTINLIK